MKTLIEERLNTYIETQAALRLGNGQELIYWSERDGWGHYYLYGADGTLKNQITSGEFVTGADRWRRREAAASCTSPPTAARRARIRTSRTSTG